MILKIIGLFLIVLIMAFIVNTIEKIRKRNNSKISFKEAMDLAELPVVTFYNGDVKLNFLLDTGSNISYINKSIVGSLNHTKTGREISHIGVEGNKSNNPICEFYLEYKKNFFKEEFSITDLDKAFDIIKKESGVQIHGILGSKFFEKHKYILDFGELTAYIK